MNIYIVIVILLSLLLAAKMLDDKMTKAILNHEDTVVYEKAISFLITLAIIDFVILIMMLFDGLR